MNKVILIGRLGADPEDRHMQNGDMIVNMRVATSERWKDKTSGEKRERTEWHRVVIFNQALARIAKQYLKSGDRVCVEGQLQTRKWEDQGGHERYSTEIVLNTFNGNLELLSDPPAGRDSAPRGEADTEPVKTTAAETAKARREEMDDEIPF